MRYLQRINHVQKWYHQPFLAAGLTRRAVLRGAAVALSWLLPAATASAAQGLGHYASLGQHTLYYEIRGAGNPVVLLHGGGSTIQESFGAQLDFLARHHQVIAIEQRGHGHTADVAGPLSYALMMADTAALLKQIKVRSADIVGFSDGGIIALMLAIHEPQLVRRVVASGANFDPHGLIDERYAEILDSAPDDELSEDERKQYAALSPDGIAHLRSFSAKLRQLWLTHPTVEELSPALMQTIRCPVLVIAGDRDEIKLEHTELIFNSIPRAQLWVVPNTAHSTFAMRSQWMNEMLASILDAR